MPVISGGGGSGGGSGSSLPIASPTGAVIDATTYADPASPGQKLTTLILADPGFALALALSGDAFPRFLLSNTGELFFGDGTSDPFNDVCAAITHTDYLYLNGNGSQIEVSEGIGVRALHSTFAVGNEQLTNRQENMVIGGGSLVAGAVAFSGGAGTPAIGGNLGDIYVRTDPGGANQTIYRCTVAGGWDNYITSVNYATPGTGYTKGDVVLVPGGNGDAAFLINNVGAGGVPIGVLGIFNRGSGYANAVNVVLTGGTGTGLTVDITASTATWVGIL